MAKTNRTISELENNLHAEAGWRKKELTTYRASILQESSISQKIMLRAGIPFLYAHWEGYIRFVAKNLINYIALQKRKNEELTPNFRLLSHINKINRLDTSNYSTKIKIIEEIVSLNNSRSTISTKFEVYTKSNLNYKRFKEICILLGIDYSSYELTEKIIDEVLLKKRNSIAHGEFINTDIKEFEELYKQIIKYIDKMKIDVQFLIDTSAFLITT